MKRKRGFAMADWSLGYNVDTGYTYGFYHELAPNWLNYVATLKGFTPPSGTTLRYLELGCGYGLGLVLLAALHPDIEFLGIDFNPKHIAHGRKLAKESGLSNIRFEEADFMDLAQVWPTGWGQFDYIAAHGIYTWLDFPVRDAFVKTIQKASSPGALVYLSYNTMPGWTTMLPFQHLLQLWQTTENTKSVKATFEGIERVQELIAANAKMTSDLPSMASRLEIIKKKDPIYLSHEYINKGWQPIWFDEMSNALGEAKLSYIGTAKVGDIFLNNILPKAQKDLLSRYDDAIMREVIIDVLVNQTFRKDVFSRGANTMWPSIKEKFILETSFLLVKAPKNGEYQFELSLGIVTGQKESYECYVRALEDGPKTIRQLAMLSGRKISETVVSLTMLLHAGNVSLYKPIADKKSAKTVNRLIIENASSGAPYHYLINPEYGTVFRGDEANLIMAHEVLSDPALKEPSKLGEKLISNLTSRGKSFSKNGQVLVTQEANLDHATAVAEMFLKTTLVRWKKLGIV